MTAIYNIYCDESGHLEHDGMPVMTLGALWRPLNKAAGIALRLREIKARHGLSPAFEVKWTKVGLTPPLAGRRRYSFYTWQMSYYYYRLYVTYIQQTAACKFACKRGCI